MNSFRVIIVGDEGVGKTSLLCRFDRDEFNRSGTPTVGADYRSRDIQIGDVSIELQIWDFSGQERYKSMNCVFYARAHGVILVLDVSSSSSCASVHTRLEEIRRHIPQGATVFLCANKIDLPSSDWKISKEELYDIANKNFLPYFEVSAASGTNVHDLFTSLGIRLLQFHSKSSFPSSSFVKDCNKETSVLLPKPSSQRVASKQQPTDHRTHSYVVATVALAVLITVAVIYARRPLTGKERSNALSLDEVSDKPCIFEPNSICPTSHTYVTVPAVNGRWPESLSWSLSAGDSDGKLPKSSVLYTVSEESFVVASSSSKCHSFTAKLCLSGDFFLYPVSDFYTPLAVEVCGKQVEIGQTLQFSTKDSRCVTHFDMKHQYDVINHIPYSGHLRAEATEEMKEEVSANHGKKEKRKRVACVGDSITYGYGAASPYDSYPAVLGRLLGSDYEARNFGVDGTTAQKICHTHEGSYWNTKEFRWSHQFLPDIVLIMLGTNDSKKRNWNADKYRTDLAALVQSYSSLPSNPVVYIMIPPRVEATEKVTEEYDIQPEVVNTVISGIIRKVGAAEEHVSVLDLSKLYVNPSKPSYIFQRGDPGYWSSDGVHPNDASYQKMAKYIYEHLT